jgi:hypothetical protein
MGHMPIEQAALDAAASLPTRGGDETDIVEGEVTAALDTVSRPAAQLAVPLSSRIEALLQPYTISLDEWAEALFDVREFPDQDPDESTMGMLAQILTAGSSEEILASMELNRAREMCGDEPGGHSPLLTIHGARPMRSEYEDGPSCYVIVDAIRKADGKGARFTTGSRAIQAAILAHAARGWLPFDAILTIRAQKTRRGFYPMNLEAGG